MRPDNDSAKTPECMPGGCRRAHPVMAAASVVALGLALAASNATQTSDEVQRPPASGKLGKLVVNVQQLTSDDGNLRFVLFDSKKSFMNQPLRAAVVDIVDVKGAWTVEELAYGEYAVLVHHDSNANGKMERHWYGKPKEPTGASNNPPPRMGPPKYDATKFALQSETLTITITINP